MLETILLKLIYALNTSLALIFVFIVLLYLTDNKDFRTKRNTVLVGFFISISTYYLSYFFYHDLTALDTVPNLAFTLISVLFITSLVVIIYLNEKKKKEKLNLEEYLRIQNHLILDEPLK